MSFPNKTKSIKGLQLTYIPSKYWTDQISGFTLVDGKSKIPSDVDFFLIWAPSTNSADYLETQMKKQLKGIPVDKLLSCRINLALSNSPKKSVKGLSLQKIYGKILPLLPASRFLNSLEIFEPTREDKMDPNFSNSIKTWALLTKFIFELLNRGSFVPLLKKQSEKKYKGHWRLLLKTNYDNTRFTNILQNSHWTAYNLPNTITLKDNGKNELEGVQVEDLWHPSYLFSLYIDKIGDLLIRSILNKEKKSFA